MQLDPHASTPVLTAGPALDKAAGVLLLIHGRGATAQSVLALHKELALPTLAGIAPQASSHTWYPDSFMAPIDQNQPYLDSALRRIDTLVSGLLAQNIPSHKIALLGFSQGACLSSEFAARHPRKYGALILFTGGLVGPPGTPRNYTGSFDNTPVFLGSSDPDPHVPFFRAKETADTLAAMGAKVDLRRYPNMPHTINTEELEAARTLLERMLAA